MDAAHSKGADQQRRHSPERVVQEGKLLGIVMGGVGEISGEAPGRIRVALLAGGNHVGAAQVRPRIGDLLDVVGAVAVIALGGLGVSEFGNFPVVGIEIGLGNLSVAAPAGGHDVELESVLVGAADGMSGMAVVANRQRFICLGYGGGMDALDELLFDAMVTVPAG